MYTEIGFCIIHDVIGHREIDLLKNEMSNIKSCGSRNLILSNNVISVGAKILFKLNARARIGFGYNLSWVNYFDKNKNRNWQVPMHIDEMVPILDESVARNNGVTEFCIKDGQLYGKSSKVHMELTIAARLSLDDSHLDNGPLIVIPGSHLGNFKECETPLTTKAGDVIVMSPLLMHASSKMKVCTRRRVMHYNFCSSEIKQFIGNKQIYA